MIIIIITSYIIIMIIIIITYFRSFLSSCDTYLQSTQERGGPHGAHARSPDPARGAQIPHHRLWNRQFRVAEEDFCMCGWSVSQVCGMGQHQHATAHLLLALM